MDARCVGGRGRSGAVAARAGALPARSPLRWIDDSIKRNIAFGLPDHQIDEEKLNHAIRASQLTELIGQLPDGIDTVVGEHGARLSGGQRQRIGIARALYNNPQVLVMDEATSSLDNITERYVIEAINNLKGERTILTIAHRLTTVQNCDTIYLMEQGEVKESGTHEELMTRSAAFRRMSLAEM
jgi:ATP-binding cassette, subfamily B, bacterial PglK